LAFAIESLQTGSAASVRATPKQADEPTVGSSDHDLQGEDWTRARVNPQPI
jgi:hypothetical protein